MPFDLKLKLTYLLMYLGHSISIFQTAGLSDPLMSNEKSSCQKQHFYKMIYNRKKSECRNIESKGKYIP